MELTELMQLQSTELTVITAARRDGGDATANVETLRLPPPPLMSVDIGGHTRTEVTELMEVSDLMQEALTLRLMAKALTEVLAMLRLPPLSLTSASSLSS